VNPGPAQLDEFRLDPLFFKLLENISKQDGRVSAFSGATVQRDNFRPLQDLNLLSLAIQASRRTAAISNLPLCSFGGSDCDDDSARLIDSLDRKSAATSGTTMVTP
jgi:hypothetical protein